MIAIPLKIWGKTNSDHEYVSERTEELNRNLGGRNDCIVLENDYECYEWEDLEYFEIKFLIRTDKHVLS